MSRVSRRLLRFASSRVAAPLSQPSCNFIAQHSDIANDAVCDRRHVMTSIAAHKV
jgi:hypothetical protein